MAFLVFNRPRARVQEVRRQGWGRKPDRSAIVANLSLAFWALVARVALRENRIVIVTGDSDAGADLFLRLLPGPEITPSAASATEGAQSPAADDGQGDPALDDVPHSGHFKIIGPKNFAAGAFRELLADLAAEDRVFTVATNDPDWMRTEIRAYSRLPGALPIFWLTLV